MAAGQIRSPIILAVDQTAIVDQKTATVIGQTLFQIDADHFSHKIFFTVNKSRPGWV